MIKTELDRKAGQIIHKVCSDFLNVRPQIFGSLVYDPEVEKAVNQMLPFPMRSMDSPAAMGLRHIAIQVIKESGLMEQSRTSELAVSGAWG
jgi:MinD-like ATPase involved in chromosome partitioning or flagellar assembly